MEDSATTDVWLIAIAGGAAGSVFTLAGGWLLAKRGERRNRLARLRAIEHELRGNKVAVDAALDGNPLPVDVNATTWSGISVALALDLPQEAYEELQTVYWTFHSNHTNYQRVAVNGGDKKDRKALAPWREDVEDAQFLVAVELRPIWKLKMVMTRLMRRIDARRLFNKAEGEKAEEAKAEEETQS